MEPDEVPLIQKWLQIQKFSARERRPTIEQDFFLKLLKLRDTEGWAFLWQVTISSAPKVHG